MDGCPLCCKERTGCFRVLGVVDANDDGVFSHVDVPSAKLNELSPGDRDGITPNRPFTEKTKWTVGVGWRSG